MTDHAGRSRDRGRRAVMTDTRSPEQRRDDARNLAYVERQRVAETMTPEQLAYYQAGRRAGLAGFWRRDQEGMTHHARACDEATNRGHSGPWTAGFRAGRDEREGR